MSNKNNILMSATRMSTYLSCKWKYYCGYVLRLPKKSNASFKLGIAVHEALAKAGKIWQKNAQFTAADVRSIKDEYREVAAREGLQNMSVYDEGLEMVLNKLDGFDVGKIITIEDSFRVITPDGITVIGAMDRIVELDEDTILIMDYKTSKYRLTQDELKSDIQLSMYDLVGSIKFPNHKRLILSLDYLRDEPVYTYRTPKERQTFAKYLVSIYNEMMKMKEKDAKPSLNEMCNWCDYKDNCSTYKEVIDQTIFKKNLNEYGDDELVEEYLNVKNKSRILYEYEKQLKDHIFQKIDSEATNLVGADKEIYIRQNGNVSYNPATVFSCVPQEDFFKMVSVGKRSVDEYLREHPELRIRIVETSQKNYTSPFLAYRTIRKK